ncbi:MAG: hypothetical protein PVG67_16010, partial [Desulfobacterales bacterium]
MSDLRSVLEIGKDKLDTINDFLLDPQNILTNQLLEVVEKFGGPAAINQKATDNGRPENLMARLKEAGSPYVSDLEWLAEQTDKGAFVSMTDYCDALDVEPSGLNRTNAVTLEISAMQYFPWLIA